jgi:hypothetical protein
MMNNPQEFAGPLRVRNIMVAVPGFPRAWWTGTNRFLLPCGTFQMRVKQGHLSVELGLDPGELDLGLVLHLKMDGVVLRLLLLRLRLMRGDRLVGLRLGWAINNLGSGGGDGGAGGGCSNCPVCGLIALGSLKNLSGFLCPHDPRQLGRGVKFNLARSERSGKRLLCR